MITGTDAVELVVTGLFFVGGMLIAVVFVLSFIAGLLIRAGGGG